MIRPTVAARSCMVLALMTAATPLAGQGIRIVPAEFHPTIEVHADDQHLRLDFSVQNLTPDTLRLARVELAVFGVEGDFVMALAWTARSDTGNAPTAVAASGETVVVPSPFSRFAKSADLTTLRFGFTWTDGRVEYHVSTTVKPVPYHVPAESGEAGRTR